MKSTNSQPKYFVKSMVALLFSLLVSCGGGSSPSPTQPPNNTQENTDWDSLIWDQDNWQ